jgi:capsule polysaccharide export protein KpsE/RkpR
VSVTVTSSSAGSQTLSAQGVATTNRQQPAIVKKFYLRPLFLLLVAIPNLLSVAYYAFIASPVYISTASLAVSNPTQTASSLVSLLAGSSTDGSIQGAYILQAYLDSWEAFQKASKTINLAENYRSGDFVSRYGGLVTYGQQNDTCSATNRLDTR